MCGVHPLDWCQSFCEALRQLFLKGQCWEREEDDDEGEALEPRRPTNNASRQAGCNMSPPSGPGVACHSALPLGPLCTPNILLKGFGQRENKLFKGIVVTLESN